MKVRPAYEVAPDVVRIEAPLPFPAPIDRINLYLLRSADGDTLVDAGMRGSEDATRAALEHFGARVDRVLLTHGHPDHWGIAGRYSPRVLCHRDARSQVGLNGDDAAAHVGLSSHLVDDAVMVTLAQHNSDFTDPPPAVEEVADGERLGEWTVLLTPGHAPGHICLYREHDGVLIAGDHLLPEITPNIHLTLETPDAVQDYLDSLRRVAKLEVSLVLPAHGEPFTDCAGRASSLIAHHGRRLDELERVLLTGPAPTSRLATQIFGPLELAEERMLAELETHAHLEHLRLRGRIALVGPDLWAPTP